MAKESSDLFSTRAAKEERKVFQEGATLVTDRLYNVIIGAVLLWGFLVNAFMCYYLSDEFLQWEPIGVVIGYFISCLLGVTLVRKSKNALVSFIGYNFIVVPVGMVLSILLTQYDPELILRAVVATAIVTGVMLIASTLYPQMFLGLGRTLAFALITVIIVELVLLFFFHVDSTAIDWIVVIIFSGYIGYDWSVANQYQKTVDNAIDSAADLYLDIINIFIRILSIMGKKRR
jgi:FtsH-binding integral membrane protein